MFYDSSANAVGTKSF